MLNSEYIHSKLTNIQSCSSEDAIHFASMIELYPYASSFSILYLKSLLNSKDIRFDCELEKHAFRIQSRGVLYDLINVKEKILISEISDPKHQQDILFFPNEITSEELLINESESRDLELDKQILSAAFSANYVDKELTQIELDSSSKEIIFLPTQEMLSPNKPEIDDLTSLSFGSWLKVNNSRAIFSEDIDFEEPKQEFYTFEKPKKEFFSPVKKAKESVDENKMPVSETLARIFELQGNFPKAIYVYEQLSLIFPKKKPYFASQINLLKKK